MELRKAKGWSQDYFAEQLGLESKNRKATISSWENDKTEPSFSDTRKIAEVLGTSVGYIIEGTTDKGIATPPVGYVLRPAEEILQQKDELLEMQRKLLKYQELEIKQQQKNNAEKEALP
ncbi:hypothetical protein BLX24_03830 [Arsenicibacter rosenii]|uniref:HTH cro/C1-type domain-containing protein n=2 Tax=Arsenicibacter rosenii TaxID=1750698 RepID=A0A1S2VRT5_9BACT|nr:hypothetical protein BLX24_03830 [Arsenicibacter rosenii]